VEEPSKDFLESQPEVDDVVLFPRKRWTQGIRSPRAWWRTGKEMSQWVKELRRRQFDVVLDFHGILKSGVLSLLSGAPKRIGFDWGSSKEGSSLFSNVKVELPKEGITRYQRGFYFLKGLGFDVSPTSGSLSIPHQDREYVDSFFSHLPVTPPRPLIAIHPGTSLNYRLKRWMPDRYAQLADRLIRETQGTVIFTWGPGELPLVEEIRKAMMASSIPAPPTQSLTQLGEVFKRCDLYIGGDTGPTLIASMMGVPVVIIYGPTDPFLYEPVGKHTNVTKEVGCNPCGKRSCKEMTCLENITVEDVLEAARNLLAGSKETGQGGVVRAS
jgi:ADP-heptose:LPS heptosyltransferase